MVCGLKNYAWRMSSGNVIKSILQHDIIKMPCNCGWDFYWDTPWFNPTAMVHPPNRKPANYLIFSSLVICLNWIFLFLWHTQRLWTRAPGLNCVRSCWLFWRPICLFFKFGDPPKLSSCIWCPRPLFPYLRIRIIWRDLLGLPSFVNWGT